jgi:hypothetical protein
MRQRLIIPRASVGLQVSNTCPGSKELIIEKLIGKKLFECEKKFVKFDESRM